MNFSSISFGASQKIHQADNLIGIAPREAPSNDVTLLSNAKELNND